MLKIGDTVRLKSGGELMTVEGLDTTDQNFVHCVWHDNKKSVRDTYHKDTLELDDGSIPLGFTV
jgi:uncharacterized protein YodC (DUF2158 family)